MQLTTTVTQKGQVTILKHLRKRFGISPYDMVLIDDYNHKLALDLYQKDDHCLP
ncbi:AbrB/MazE/SpoVT family DNA-binding domain-containing protein [Candidatus Roizmanbacteria bacterium]|nr:AbrB/MazE/SpoVT family DNA-binding domain-containing protein [Candidatus Roizmanbacteria bacterium]